MLDRFLHTHRLPPLDRFGQHFLVDGDVLAEILAAIETDPAVPVIEVGAGLGVLTRALAHARQQAAGSRQPVAPLIAVELDRRLVPLLRERVRAFPHVRVAQEDILRTDVGALLKTRNSELQTPYDVVGNIPYNITAPLLQKFLGPPRLPRTDAARLVRGPRRMTLLLDRAVAAVLAARPPRMSIRTIAAQAYAKVCVERDKIPPSAFVPPPTVSSAIVVLKTLKKPQISAQRAAAFFRLVRAGFSQKRKTLANALAATYRMAPADAAARLRRADIDPRRRAQTLSIEEWVRLLGVW